jgi:cobalt-zinc-cadmium efflux system membrane fusion protein
MKVKAGTPLFELSSPDFVVAQKLFFQAKEELLLAEKKLKRQQNLSAYGVGTQKDLEEAQANYEIERKEFENAGLAIRLFKADPGKLILGQALVVYAPISGEVVEDKIVVGQFVKSDAPSISRIAELSSVWVAAQVKEKDMNFIRFPQECRVSAAALPGKYICGNIKHVSGFVNEDTRSTEVLIECGNKDRSLRPGMYVTVDFIHPPVNTILIPAKSVLQQSNASFVFKRIAKGAYIKQVVEAKSVDSGKSVIQAGLVKNDVIISDGAYFLTAVK